MNADALVTICVGLPLVGVISILIRGAIAKADRSARRSTLTPPGLYRVLSVFQWGFMTVAFLVYSTSLFTPAMRNDWGGGLLLGWQVLAVGFPFWGLNAYFLVSPMVLLWMNWVQDFWLQVIAFGFQLACALIVLYTVIHPDRNDIHGPHPGAILWSVAFWLVLAAYAVPSTLIREAKKQPPEESVREWTEW
jgi:hypothetical protein